MAKLDERFGNRGICMEPKEVVRYLTSSIETRKEILGLVYSRGKKKGKKIEWWINIEMLAKLLELKEKKYVDEVEGEHPYPLRKIDYPRCDLWWKKNDSEHWLEVKTFRFHEDSKGLKDDYEERIEEDLERVQYLEPPYTFHHLLIVFDDENYDNGNWKEDVYSIYDIYDMKKEDKWKFDVNQRKTVYAFLHYKSEDK